MHVYEVGPRKDHRAVAVIFAPAGVALGSAAADSPGMAFGSVVDFAASQPPRALHYASTKELCNYCRLSFARDPEQHPPLPQIASRSHQPVLAQENRGPPVKHPVQRRRSHSVLVARFRKRTENYLFGTDHNPPTVRNKSGCVCEWRPNDPCKGIGLAQHGPV